MLSFAVTVTVNGIEPSNSPADVVVRLSSEWASVTASVNEPSAFALSVFPFCDRLESPLIYTLSLHDALPIYRALRLLIAIVTALGPPSSLIVAAEAEKIGVS